MTLEEWATEYVRTVNGPLNGWGQCVHLTLGASHDMLNKMTHEFGTEAAYAAIAKCFEANKPG